MTVDAGRHCIGF